MQKFTSRWLVVVLLAAGSFVAADPIRNDVTVGVSLLPRGVVDSLMGDNEGYYTTGILSASPGTFAVYERRVLRYFSTGLGFQYAHVVGRSTDFDDERDSFGDLFQIPLFVRGVIPLANDRIDLFLTVATAWIVYYPHPRPSPEDRTRVTYPFLNIEPALGVRFRLPKHLALFLEGAWTGSFFSMPWNYWAIRMGIGVGW